MPDGDFPDTLLAEHSFYRKLTPSSQRHLSQLMRVVLATWMKEPGMATHSSRLPLLEPRNIQVSKKYSDGARATHLAPTTALAEMLPHLPMNTRKLLFIKYTKKFDDPLHEKVRRGFVESDRTHGVSTALTKKKAITGLNRDQKSTSGFLFFPCHSLPEVRNGKLLSKLSDIRPDLKRKWLLDKDPTKNRDASIVAEWERAVIASKRLTSRSRSRLLSEASPVHTSRNRRA